MVCFFFLGSLRYTIINLLSPIFYMHSWKAYDLKYDNAPNIDYYAEHITNTLRAEMKKYGISTKGVMIEFEPGRSMYGPTGIF